MQCPEDVCNRGRLHPPVPVSAAPPAGSAGVAALCTCLIIAIVAGTTTQTALCLEANGLAKVQSTVACGVHCAGHRLLALARAHRVLHWGGVASFDAFAVWTGHPFDSFILPPPTYSSHLGRQPNACREGGGGQRSGSVPAGRAVGGGRRPLPGRNGADGGGGVLVRVPLLQHAAPDALRRGLRPYAWRASSLCLRGVLGRTEGGHGSVVSPPLLLTTTLWCPPSRQSEDTNPFSGGASSLFAPGTFIFLHLPGFAVALAAPSNPSSLV